MEDRRQMRRFTLQLPCLIYDWNDVRDELLFEARTVNISTGGALVKTDRRLPVGMPVHFSLLIRRNRSDEEISTGGCVSLNGQVVRGDDAGLGVAFSEEYRIMRTSHLIGQCNAVSHWLRQTKTGEKAPLLINR
ncbi:PilZ domain-containing protein [uncultured Desulfosarcina sp.]|uniref:PilZ domain-containing protein n=1 Tax=uncultured Desulfosarcina sp. TaxID=218289 RepID=UPI0029C95662|nr:PilZ domain-containing protein [uncultured Desulfosarcina sp.]